MTELVKVEGLKELREALFRKVPLHMQGPTLQKALAAGARPIVAMAKQLAPVKSGTLRRSIFSFRNKDSLPTYEARSIRPRYGKKAQKTGRDAFYWRFVEFGFQAGKKLVPARPFLRPAFESQKSQALAAIVERLKKEIVVAASKASWKTSADRGSRSAKSSVSDIGNLFDRLG